MTRRGDMLRSHASSGLDGHGHTDALTRASTAALAEDAKTDTSTCAGAGRRAGRRGVRRLHALARARPGTVEPQPGGGWRSSATSTTSTARAEGGLGAVLGLEAPRRSTPASTHSPPGMRSACGCSGRSGAGTTPSGTACRSRGRRTRTSATGSPTPGHSAAHALSRCARNLTDPQLDGIGASGGLVGIVFAAAFLRGDGAGEADTPLERITAHARWARRPHRLDPRATFAVTSFQ